MVISSGSTVVQALRRIGVSEQTLSAGGLSTAAPASARRGA